MKKLLIMLFFVSFCNNAILSQNLSLYKVENSITSVYYDIYLLLYPSGNYFLLGEYNYGEPVVDFYHSSDSDILPMDVLLSFGTYVSNESELVLNDSFLNYKQVFSAGTKFLIGEKTFDFLINKKLIRVKQSIKEYLNDSTLEYYGGVLHETRLMKQYSGLTPKYQRESQIQFEEMNSHQNEILALNVGIYYDRWNMFSLELGDNNYFCFKLGVMPLISGNYHIAGAKLTLESDLRVDDFLLRIINDTAILSFSLPGLFPGDKFSLKK